MKSLLLISFLLIFSSCITYDNVRFEGVEHFKMGDFNKDELTFTVNVKVYNPNNYKIKVKNGTLDVLNNKDKKIGQIKLLNKVVLKKKESGSYPVKLKARLVDLIFSGGGSILDLVKSKNTRLRFRGKVKVKAFGIGKKLDVDEVQSIDLEGFLPSFGR